jgi:flagella basal body P-ring formation protein FlgA
MPRTILTILAFLLAAPCFAGSIRLRTAATAGPDAPIRLGDVATLEGDDALAFAGLTLVEDPVKAAAGRGWTSISLAEVRAALERAGARLSLITLSGAACTVRVPFEAASEEAPAAAPSRATPQPIDLTGPPTVRTEAGRTLAAHLDIDPSRLRVLFDEADRAFLDAPRHGHRVVVSPAATPASKRLVLAARVFEQDRLIDSRTLRADVETRRAVVVLRDALRRGREITADALDEQEAWLPLGGGRPIERLEDAAGLLARTRLEAGTILREEHLDSPVIVRRNELVTIHAVQSGFEVRTRARAREEARRGDVIEFRLEGAQKTFPARVEAPGVAVIDLDGPASNLKEAAP